MTGEIISKSASRTAGLRIMSAAVMSYRTHPDTAARMRRVPTPDKAEARGTARHCPTHFMWGKGQIQPALAV
jgi:hypothetical protein